MAFEISEVITPANRRELRAWLTEHHDSGKTEVWVQTFQKSTQIPCVTYDELVEEVRVLAGLTAR